MPFSFHAYKDHFGLSRHPFALPPDPEFLYWSRPAREAYGMLRYGLSSHAAVTLFTGESGAGKTIMAQHFLSELAGDDALAIAQMKDASLGRRGILHALMPNLPLSEIGDDQWLQQVQHYLGAEDAESRRKLLIIDDAHDLPPEALDDLQGLTGLRMGGHQALQLLLIGQPELRDRMRLPGLVQFVQRVVSNYHVPNLPAVAVYSYIAHRLRLAGAGSGIFSEQAAQCVNEVTDGVPRLINSLCDLALSHAYAARRDRVTAQLVQAVVDDGLFVAPTTSYQQGRGLG